MAPSHADYDVTASSRRSLSRMQTLCNYASWKVPLTRRRNVPYVKERPVSLGPPLRDSPKGGRVGFRICDGKPSRGGRTNHRRSRRRRTDDRTEKMETLKQATPKTAPVSPAAVASDSVLSDAATNLLSKNNLLTTICTAGRILSASNCGSAWA